jgi:hypothetical protein
MLQLHTQFSSKCNKTLSLEYNTAELIWTMVSLKPSLSLLRLIARRNNWNDLHLRQNASLLKVCFGMISHPATKFSVKTRDWKIPVPHFPPWNNFTSTARKSFEDSENFPKDGAKSLATFPYCCIWMLEFRRQTQSMRKNVCRFMG